MMGLDVIFHSTNTKEGAATRDAYCLSSALTSAIESFFTGNG